MYRTGLALEIGHVDGPTVDVDRVIDAVLDRAGFSGLPRGSTRAEIVARGGDTGREDPEQYSEDRQ
ncbi:hypothetical protein [Natrarchaeobaculum sulfurireducens]|uniref:hypothetical protein n=1 Tax=Natrarchaeobaculum sulfurireducens TaxID=2044521 RepID=UPI000E3B5DC7|nr:hypothetical protein [Natrarchaeobaculum sulfurireducens]